jgi:hypothetical protein
MAPTGSSKLPEKFLVAFSLAGEERDLVRAIACAVQEKLAPETVFLDEWFEYYIAGDGADLKLQKIYRDGCELVVMCVSGKYGGKAWTLLEHAAIRARLLNARVSGHREMDRVLPIRVGDGEVEGIESTTIVPDARKNPVSHTVELILNRLRLVAPQVAGQFLQRSNPRFIYLAETPSDMDEDRVRMQTFLESLGWEVVPSQPYAEAEYRKCVESELPRCRAFVQLLGRYAWKRGGFDRIQAEVAKASSIPRYRFRSSDLDLAKIEPLQHDFITEPDVIAASFEDFKQHLEKQLALLTEPSSPPAGADVSPRVLVSLHCQNPDPVWDQVFQWIYEQERLDYAQVRSDESVLTKFECEPCHGFLIICDSSALNDDEKSPRETMEQCRQIQLKQKDSNRRPPVGLIYWPPPAASWARLLRTTPLKLHRILADHPANLGEFFAEVRKVAG